MVELGRPGGAMERRQRPGRLVVAVTIASVGVVATLVPMRAFLLAPASAPRLRRSLSVAREAGEAPQSAEQYPGQAREKWLYDNHDNYAERAAADIDWDANIEQEVAEKTVNLREVKVEDQRDLNELLRLPNPMRPTPEMQLVKLIMDDGTVVTRPKLQDLKNLRPTSLRPVTFVWKDKSEYQTGAPKEYDEIIQRLLNSSPSDMEELVRSNWKKFDQAFFFRITELKEDATQPHLKEKLNNLEKFAVQIIQAAQEQMRKQMPDQAKDAKEILNSMLEEDGDTLLWPPPPEAYARLAEAITLRATRAKYEDGWFENVLEGLERFGKRMETKQQQVYFNIAQVAMQRIVTEWLRNDDLWEETNEGQFLYRLMSITHEQWETQLFYEKDPIDAFKVREELKIISETKIVGLPMASKLQIYAAKYIQAIVEFIGKKDELLKQKEGSMA